MRSPLALALALLCGGFWLAFACPSAAAAPAPLTRGLLVSVPAENLRLRVAFVDALLDTLAQAGGAETALLAPQAALWEAAGLGQAEFTALFASPPEDAAPLLADLAPRLRLDEIVCVAVMNPTAGAQAQILWARPFLGQVRLATVEVTQSLSPDTAALLAGKTAQLLRTGWDRASILAASGAPSPQPALPETPIPPVPPPPATPPPQAAPDSLVQQARAALRKGEINRALDLARRALDTGEDRIEALLLRAEIHAVRQDTEQQRIALAAAIALDAGLYTPRLELAALEQARGLWQAAARLVDEALAADPQRPEAYLQAAALYRDQRRPEHSLEYLQSGVRANPASALLLRVLAEEYHRRELLGAAEETWARLAAVTTGAERARAFAHLGHMYAAAARFPAAFEAYRQAGESDPRGLQPYYEELFRACDSAVQESLDDALAALHAFARTGADRLPREEAYQRITRNTREIAELRDFAESIAAPSDAELLHAQRLLYFALALEAATSAQVFVDTGDAALQTQAEQRYQEALAEARKLIASP